MRIIIMLNIQHLTKVYGEKKAVDDLSLHIAPGEIYGFIGHNGAGKTTTLRSVVGILQFDAGEITIGGKSIRTDPIACKRELAYIPDNPDLYDYMTGIRYLNFIADIFGVSSEVRGQRIHDYAARFELTDDLAQPIAAYSHGMKQKLAIISAWLHQPRLIIMDEPFVGLDPKASHLLKGMMREFCDAGGAIFFSTHVLEVAEKLRHHGGGQGRRLSGGGLSGAGGRVMLKLLVKKQLTEIFRAYLYDAKKNRARSKAATVGYIIFFILLMVGVIGGMFTLLSLAMCQDMAKVGMS